MRVFITGITGTLGTALTRLHVERGDTVSGCCRNEAHAVEWLAQHGKLATLLLCDAVNLRSRHTDAGRLLPSVDRLYHCAAMKHVDLCEQQPVSAFQQNVWLTEHVAGACRDAGVFMVLASSDKACLPQGVYGATKLMAERVALRHGQAAVRMGNLIGSSGSVFAIWKEARGRGEPIRLTDPEMTRYFLPVAEAARLMADRAVAGTVHVPQPLKAVRMGDAARAIAGDSVIVTGPRPGETRHQWLTETRSSATAERWKMDDLLREI